MPGKKDSVFIQHIPESIDESLLRGFVKINHHIAAKDEVQRPMKRPGLHEIEVFEGDEISQFLSDLISVLAGSGMFSGQIAVFQGRGKACHAVCLVTSGLGDLQYPR